MPLNRGTSWVHDGTNWRRATPAARAKIAVKDALRRPFEVLGYDLRKMSQRPWVYDPMAVQSRLVSSISEPVVFDVGANVGQTLQRYARAIPNARIHCFEPFPASYRSLAETASAYARATAHELALGDDDTERILHASTEFHTRNSLLERPTEGRTYWKGGTLDEEVTVRVEKLDTFRARMSIDRIDILKIDVQGAEGLLLDGARATLDAGAIGIIFTEVMFVPHYEGGILYDDLAARLRGHGFSLLNIYDPILAGNAQLRYANALFVSDDVRARVLAPL